LNGEAKRRATAYANAKESLLSSVGGDDLVVANAAITLFERFIATKRYTCGCYVTAMFLALYLREHTINAEPVIGYANDSTDDIFMSLAWLEHGGRKVDLTIHLTDYADAQLPGDLLVLDHVLRPSNVQHTYSRELTAAAQAQYEAMAADPQMKMLLQHKDQEHWQMQDRASDPEKIKAFPEAAPLGLRFSDMRQVLD
jgi:hypothetical protein